MQIIVPALTSHSSPLKSLSDIASNILSYLKRRVRPSVNFPILTFLVIFLFFVCFPIHFVVIIIVSLIVRNSFPEGLELLFIFLQPLFCIRKYHEEVIEFALCRFLFGFSLLHKFVELVVAVSENVIYVKLIQLELTSLILL